MAHVLVMPRQGNSVESCVLVSWRAAEGARVGADTVVCEVETDKATFEVPAGAEGVLLKRLHAEGEDVPVLEPIGVIGEPGEAWEAAITAGAAATGAAAPEAASPDLATAASAAAPPASPESAPAVGRISSSPRARRAAEADGVPLEALAGAGTGPHGRVIERDVLAAAAARPTLTVAARAAALAGAPLPAAGTALGGRAGVADLAAARAPAPPVAPQPIGEGVGYTDAPLKNIRKIIAERMRASLASTAQLTLHASAPAARLTALRARLKGSAPELGLADVTIGDLVLFVVSRTLPRFPDLNAHLLGTTVRTFERVHLGLAVDTPRGLIVPVIRNADVLSLPALSAESKRLAAACQSGSVDPADLSGATFTVSNLGAFGVEMFTPVLNAPQTGVLGVNAITQGVVAGPDGAPVLEPRIGLSLTVDHQVIDGAPAARMLKAFADGIAMVDLVVASGRTPGGSR